MVNAKEKGRGVVTTKVFEKDEYICEYGGHLITNEAEHEQDGTFMFYFVWMLLKNQGRVKIQNNLVD